MTGGAPDELDCSAVIADVWLFLDDECDQATRARVKRHMESCPSCLATFGIEEKLKYLLERKCGGEHAPEGLRRRLSLEIRRTVVTTRIERGEA
ncbi:mycothiol system anti-sigma-R factor [Tomitella gaofuii]|uniref:mycothiol system anti-sigma-R factor n=1 Tax=Tomitella gaofuii TaxID=2760083 RepID=UPI0015F8E240|nr:mycothiol system anti-sigma-R factor [Tomitella gaofuii]